MGVAEGVAEVRGGRGEGALKGLRKGEGIQKRKLVKAKKREKGQDIGGGARGEEKGRILKRVKSAGEEKKEQKYLQ